jgi:hypothetical protein
MQLMENFDGKRVPWHDQNGQVVKWRSVGAISADCV